MAIMSYGQTVAGFTLKSHWQYIYDVTTQGQYIPAASSPQRVSKTVMFDFVLPADATNIRAHLYWSHGAVSDAPYGYNLQQPVGLRASPGSNHLLATVNFSAKQAAHETTLRSGTATIVYQQVRLSVIYESESGASGRTNRSGYQGHNQQGEPITEYFYNTDATTDGEAFRSIITVHEQDSTDWRTNGLGILMPESCEVTEEAGGDWSLSMSHPVDDEGRWELLKVDRLIRCPVPARQNPEAALAYKAEHRNEHQIYRALKGVSVRTFNNRGSQIIGSVIKDEEFEVIDEDKLGGYLKIVKSDGTVGWIIRGIGTYQEFVRTDETLSEDADGEQFNSVVQRAQIRNQMFRIYSVDVDAVARTVQVQARHISYDYAANIVQEEWIVSDKLPSQVLADLPGKLKIEDKRTLLADLTEHHVSGDYSYINPINVLLDPDIGVVPQAQLQLIRDNNNIYLLSNEHPADRGYIIAYGKNLTALKWTTSTEDLVTVILPTGEQKNGKPLFLPENGGYVESAHKDDYPFIRISKLEVKQAKVGKQYTDERTGQVIDKSLTESECYELMRKAVQKEWDAGCDLPTVEVEVDFTQLEATEEYKELANLYQLFLYDVVHIRHEPLGYDYDAQVTQYVFDAVAGRYKSIKVGKLFKDNQGQVAGYQLSQGSVSGSKIAPQSVTAANLQDASITNAKIAYAAIEAANIHTINADTITSGTIETKRLKVTDRLEVADGATVIGAINQATQEHAQDKQVYPSEAIQYVANDALAITPDGLVMKSGGRIDIVAGSAFTVNAPNMKVTDDGTISARNAVFNDVQISIMKRRVLTTGDIVISSDEPTNLKDRMVWIQPLGGGSVVQYACDIPARNNYDGVNEFTMAAQSASGRDASPQTFDVQIPFAVASALTGTYYVRAEVTDGVTTVDLGGYAIPLKKTGAMTAAYSATSAQALGSQLTIRSWVATSATGKTAVSTTNIYNTAGTTVLMTVSSSGGSSTEIGWHDCTVRYYVGKPCTSILFTQDVQEAFSGMDVGDSITLACDVTPADTTETITYALRLSDEATGYTLNGNVLTKTGSQKECYVDAYCGNQTTYMASFEFPSDQDDEEPTPPPPPTPTPVWSVSDFKGSATYYYLTGGSTGTDIQLPAGRYRWVWQYDDKVPADKTIASYVKIGSASATRVNKNGPGPHERYITLTEDSTVSLYLYASSSGFSTLGYPLVTSSLWEAEDAAAAAYIDEEMI